MTVLGWVQVASASTLVTTVVDGLAGLGGKRKGDGK